MLVIFDCCRSRCDVVDALPSTGKLHTHKTKTIAINEKVANPIPSILSISSFDSA
jgi:hypothetical protein